MTVRDTPRTLTADEFELYALLPENRDRRLQLIGGTIVEAVSHTVSSRLGIYIGGRLSVFAEDRDLGFVTGADGGYIVAGERYIPDAAFVSKRKQAEQFVGVYNPVAPDLAVEVLSPTNTEPAMRVKVSNYLYAGTTVWLVDVEARRIEIHAPRQPARVLHEDATLEGDDLLPGFSLSVAAIFARLGRAPETSEAE